MTGPRWVGVRAGRNTVVLDRETGVRTIHTATSRRSGMGWKDRALATGLLTLGLALCALFPVVVATAWALIGALVLVVCAADAAKRTMVRLGIWIRVR